MVFPDWAVQAFDLYKPVDEFRSDGPNPSRVGQWEALRARIAGRWKEVDAEKWRVPRENSRAWLRLLPVTTASPADFVRMCILECAIDCAQEFGTNKTPGKVIAAVRELDDLNQKISDTAETLAALFRQRDQLKKDYSLSDRWSHVEANRPDPFELHGALDLTLNNQRFGSASFRFQEGLKALYAALASKYRDRPTIADLLDVISWRDPRTPAPLGAGDLASVGSKTNKSEWSPLALRLIGMLDDWQLPGQQAGFLLDCLTHGQLATLAMVAYDAPPEAFSATQIRELIKRYRQRKSVA